MGHGDACVTGIAGTEHVELEVCVGWDEQRKMSSEVPSHGQPMRGRHTAMIPWEPQCFFPVESCRGNEGELEHVHVCAHTWMSVCVCVHRQDLGDHLFSSSTDTQSVVQCSEKVPWGVLWG